ncbi:hypothetical protein SAMN05660874_04428 [Saccharopolyspora flava]|uniref:Uncharacterized protein n=2 Tax=Saccharopolyspora flava TaxID=95161 RepID=A0A1I6TYL5_9PSEU|nr:hypothetical protein SAMN05660874_04428 [Saccharopolyspora flava]
MQEYLRRSAVWAQELDATREWPFFDLAAHVDTSIRANPQALDALKSNLESKTTGTVVFETCESMLHWSALKDSGHAVLPALDDPFEPLIVMYERGGGFTSGKGFIDFDGLSMPVRTWRDRLEPVPAVLIDDTVLDELDKES